MKIKLLVLTAFFFVSHAAFSQVDFKQGTVFEMLCMAKEQNKIIMVDVMTEWCKWCIELDNKVYAKSEVYDFANANQVNYKIDAEKGEGIAFAKRYKIEGYPSILFIDSDGKEIDRIYGYVPVKDFKEMMVDYNKGVNTYAALKKEVEKNQDNIEASLKLADKYSMYGETDKAKALLKNIIELDPDNSKGKTDDAKYRLILFSDKDKKAKDLESFISENKSSDQLRDAYVSLAETYYFELNDQTTSEKWFKEGFEKFPNDDMLNSSYGQILNSTANQLADKKYTADDSAKGLVNTGKFDADYKNGLALVDAALPYVKGSVNEASSYYIQSKLLYNLKEYSKALESIDKALIIFNRKLYRDHKEKVEKQLSSN